jgi:hypothetical protein
MKSLLFLVICIFLTGCHAKHSRVMNKGEETLVSDQVRALVMAADDGLLDIRGEEKVRCERIRIVGTHMVKRLCYTTDEEEEMAHKTREEYFKSFGFQKCVDRSACSGN